METKLLFENKYKLWTQVEDEQLNKLYNIELLDIIEISKIHNRTPGGIISRLIKNNYITDKTCARGYLDYINSNLYKEICNKNNDIEKMKKEILELKNKVNELSNMMKTVYENMGI
jgi:hypothetical protein